MEKLPEFWCIANTRQEIRDWFAEKYGVPDIKMWRYNIIGWEGEECHSHNGVYGAPAHSYYKAKKNILISWEDFERFILKKELLYQIF